MGDMQAQLLFMRAWMTSVRLQKQLKDFQKILKMRENMFSGEESLDSSPDIWEYASTAQMDRDTLS